MQDSPIKDYFSGVADLYVQFRPTYPKELIDVLLSHVPARKTAWDCATGNGQLAAQLAPHFETILATDISKEQLHNAQRLANITYLVERAEQTSFSDNLFDLITVGQAVHWFDFDKFFREVQRTLKPRGILALIGYTLFRIDEHVDPIIAHFYETTVGPYWPPERRYIDEHYSSIPFPLKEIATPTFSANYEWTLDHVVGFLNSWSSVLRYIKRHGRNPVEFILPDLRTAWGDSTKIVTFPMFARVGMKEP